jgi:pyrroloquinoline-quinone synthase
MHACDERRSNRIVDCIEVMATMETKAFLSLLAERIQQYDLLCHPFYKAWSAGELTRDDLRAYAEEYYPHVEAFPGYLAQLSLRLEEGELRRAVLANMADEKGSEDSSGNTGDSSGETEPPHAELWLDFVEGLGGSRIPVRKPIAEVRQLISFFERVASEGTPEEALAAFYAYESQVPRVATEKDRGLREIYAADEKTRGYFTLHATADVHHSQVWRKQLEKRVNVNPDPDTAEKALAAAESAAKALWTALDGIEARRTQRAAA